MFTLHICTKAWRYHTQACVRAILARVASKENEKKQKSKHVQVSLADMYVCYTYTLPFRVRAKTCKLNSVVECVGGDKCIVFYECKND